MKKAVNKKIIDLVISALIQRNRPEDAVDLIELSALSGVRPTEAFLAINYMINAGFRIRLTENFPRKFYCENEEESREESEGNS